MPLETLLFGAKDRSTAYSTRQLLDKLRRMGSGITSRLPAGRQVAFSKGVLLTREEILAAIEDELAAFAALDQARIRLKEQRRLLQARLPLIATVVRDLAQALTMHAGHHPHLRKALGVAPGKKPRKLKPEERVEATAKLNATRKRNGTDAESRRIRNAGRRRRRS